MKSLPLLFVLLLTCCIGCNKAKQAISTNDPSKDKSLLRICFSSEVQSFDPRLSIDLPSEHALKMLFEGLMRFNLEDKLIPAVADSYEISEDQKTYTFHLRPTQWSNEEKVTAHDFEYAWKKAIDPSFKGAGVQNFYPIKNVQDVVQGKKAIDEVGIRCLDDKTLVVELEHPTPYFLEVVSYSCFSPVHKDTDLKDPKWASQVGPAFVCNGPFLLQKHKFDDEIVVLKNPHYWDASHVRLAGIKIAIIKDAQTQLGMFEKNDLQWIGKPVTKLPLDAVPHLRRTGIISQLPSLGVQWFFLNTTVFPFNNKKMRKAFAYAINREEITSHILQEGETPALGILPQHIAVSHVPYFLDYDVAEAKKLFNEALEELGITKEQLPIITLSHTTTDYNQRIAQVIQQQWYEAFGIRVNLEHSDWKVHYQKLVSGNFQIGAMGWNSWLRDPIYMLQTFRDSTDSVNMSRWINPHYQQLLAASEEEIDPMKRKAIFYEAEKLLMDEMPVIPLYFTAISYAKSKMLKDVYVSELNKIDFKWAYLETK